MSIIGDCDDSLENGLSVYPDALEICDGIDNDCDTMIDLLDDNFSGSVLTLYVIMMMIVLVMKRRKH